METKIRIIGDVHGLTKAYLKLVKEADYSVQLGDHNFDYSHMADLDPTRHKIVGGNHDNYDKLVHIPHYLGDYGMVELGGLSFFFIRGGFSVDHKYRIPGISWWEQEELTYEQCLACIEAFKLYKPSLVLSHECPFECCRTTNSVITNSWKVNPSKTCQMLQECWYSHKPEVWIFGHHHNRGWQQKLGDTQFMCLGELNHVDFIDGE